MLCKSCEANVLEATDISITNWRLQVQKLNVDEHLFCVKIKDTFCKIYANFFNEHFKTSLIFNY